jgi:hypothetical protein
LAHIWQKFLSFLGKKQQDISDVSVKWQRKFRSAMSQAILTSYEIEVP